MIPMLEELNQKIINLLIQDGRISYYDLAKRLNVPESTIRSRIRSLKEKGVIKGFTTIIDPTKLGYGSIAIVGVDVKAEKFIQVTKKLTQFPEVKFAATCSGDHMIMIEIWMSSGEDLREFIRTKIENIDGVLRTCPAIVTEKLTSSQA